MASISDEDDSTYNQILSKQFNKEKDCKYDVSHCITSSKDGRFFQAIAGSPKI